MLGINLLYDQDKKSSIRNAGRTKIENQKTETTKKEQKFFQSFEKDEIWNFWTTYDNTAAGKCMSSLWQCIVFYNRRPLPPGRRFSKRTASWLDVVIDLIDNYVYCA